MNLITIEVIRYVFVRNVRNKVACMIILFFYCVKNFNNPLMVFSRVIAEDREFKW